MANNLIQESINSWLTEKNQEILQLDKKYDKVVKLPDIKNTIYITSGCYQRRLGKIFLAPIPMIGIAIPCQLNPYYEQYKTNQTNIPEEQLLKKPLYLQMSFSGTKNQNMANFKKPFIEFESGVNLIKSSLFDNPTNLKGLTAQFQEKCKVKIETLATDGMDFYRPYKFKISGIKSNILKPFVEINLSNPYHDGNVFTINTKYFDSNFFKYFQKCEGSSYRIK